MHEQLDEPAIGLVWVGFSPPQRLAALSRRLRWPGLVLADPQRDVYRTLGFGRAPVWRIYSPRTILTYARAVAGGQKLSRPAEDTRQLGGDAVVVDGSVLRVWRPRSPDDRPTAAEVINAATQHLPNGRSD